MKYTRESAHATFNGGHHDEPAHAAFHHGMDTVFNLIDAGAVVLPVVAEQLRRYRAQHHADCAKKHPRVIKRGVVEVDPCTCGLDGILVETIERRAEADQARTEQETATTAVAHSAPK